MFIVDIPSRIDIETQNCVEDQCVHGKCIRYSNNSQNYFLTLEKNIWMKKGPNYRLKPRKTTDPLARGAE